MRKYATRATPPSMVNLLLIPVLGPSLESVHHSPSWLPEEEQTETMNFCFSEMSRVSSIWCAIFLELPCVSSEKKESLGNRFLWFGGVLLLLQPHMHFSMFLSPFLTEKRLNFLCLYCIFLHNIFELWLRDLRLQTYKWFHFANNISHDKETYEGSAWLCLL